MIGIWQIVSRLVIQSKVARNHESTEKKAVIVLGGGLDTISRNGQTVYVPQKQVIDRLEKAYELFANSNVDYIVTTGRYSKRAGVDPDITGSKTEAEVGKEYLEEKHHEVKDRILYENQSFDTIGNAWFAKKLCLEPFNIKHCTIITSDYHQDRSKLIFDWVLGPEYEVEYIGIPSQLSDEEKKARMQLEEIWIAYINKYLTSCITKGDNEAIEGFIKYEHLRYCLSERSEAMLDIYIKTASVAAGY